MRITIEPTTDQSDLPAECLERSVSVSIDRDGLMIDEIVDLFKSALLAVGYHPETVNRVWVCDERKDVQP